MSQIVACANQKGGVGKTTTVVSLAAALAAKGRRVLLVDLDPQGNGTSGLGIDRSSLETSVYDALVGEIDPAEVILPTAISGLSIAPSSRDLAGVEVELVPAPQRERRLERFLAPLGTSYDHVLLDTPPSVGLLTVNGLTAADAVLIPIQCEYYALEGLSELLSTIDLIREHLNPRLTVNGVVLTMYDARTALAADVASEVRNHLGSLVYQSVIPRSVRLAEAPSYGQPITTYRPDSKGAIAYTALAEEFLARSSGRLDRPAAHALSTLQVEGESAVEPPVPAKFSPGVSGESDRTSTSTADRGSTDTTSEPSATAPAVAEQKGVVG